VLTVLLTLDTKIGGRGASAPRPFLIKGSGEEVVMSVTAYNRYALRRWNRRRGL